MKPIVGISSEAAVNGRRMTLQELEAALWGAANILRGRTAGQDYKNYILSLMFYKRLSDQWQHEADEAIGELEREQGRAFSDAEKAVFRARGEHRYAIPDGARWGDVKAASTNLGETLTTAMKAVANANDELRGVFTIDWNQPAPDGSGRPLIPNEVVHALIQHFDELDLSNRSVPPDVLGRAYEFLIKQFADDAGAKAGEFFTPPAVVDALVRMLEPRPGDTVYDPTCGSGGMLVHAGDFLRETKHSITSARYFGQEMNWSNAAIAKINSVLHGLEADIRAGASTITDPLFAESEGHADQFSLVLANFPFSDEYWWLRPEQQTDDKKKKARLKKEIFGKAGYRDRFGRFGRGTAFPAPPANYGDYAFVLHILASLTDHGRAGIVCPQGVLFRGQPQTEEETGELDRHGNPKVKRRKADDEHLIRHALLDSGYVDAVIALPLNVFYGAGVPACLVLLRKNRDRTRKDRVLVVYAARHFRDLSGQNELRPQDVMRILVHYHAYGDAMKVPQLVETISDRIRTEITDREEEEIGRLYAEYEPNATAVERTRRELEVAVANEAATGTPSEKKRAAARSKKLRDSLMKSEAKLRERDKQISGVRATVEDDRRDLEATAQELIAMYLDEGELLRHARVVDMPEIAENDFNLNVPRYVDTFDPPPYVAVPDALMAIRAAQGDLLRAEEELSELLSAAGYGV